MGSRRRRSGSPRTRQIGRLRVTRALALPGVAVGAAVLVAGAGALASLETGTVGSFGQGLWWAVALMTTVGFVRDDSTVFEAGERSADAEILRRLADVQDRLAALERETGSRGPGAR